MRLLLAGALFLGVSVSTAASAATPYPRFIDGKATTAASSFRSTLKVEAKDAGPTGDEGSATWRVAGSEPVDLRLTCVNVLSNTSAIASGVAGDEVTAYLVVIEDNGVGVGKDRFTVTQNQGADTLCASGIVPPLPEPAAVKRGDLYIRNGA